jgi:hypothetical protein
MEQKVTENNRRLKRNFIVYSLLKKLKLNKKEGKLKELLTFT